MLPQMPLFQIMVLSQTVNAILLPVILILVLMLANDKTLMGKWTNKTGTNALAVGLTVIIFLATIVLFVTQFMPA
jgi:Mn2+/Fe2+ NRAMP family transporter